LLTGCGHIQGAREKRAEIAKPLIEVDQADLLRFQREPQLSHERFGELQGFFCPGLFLAQNKEAIGKADELVATADQFLVEVI